MPAPVFDLAEAAPLGSSLLDGNGGGFHKRDWRGSGCDVDFY